MPLPLPPRFHRFVEEAQPYVQRIRPALAAPYLALEAEYAATALNIQLREILVRDMGMSLGEVTELFGLLPKEAEARREALLDLAALFTVAAGWGQIEEGQK